MYHFMNNSFEELAGREFLVTNGLGGYASGTLAGANARRYHGLLVAARNPPTDRQVLVSKVEETLLTEAGAFELASNRYGTERGPDVVHPQGWQHLVSFERLPLPRWVYQVGEYTLAKTVFMVQTSNTTIVGYKNLSKKTVSLRVMPLLTQRDYHSLFHQNDHYNFYIAQTEPYLKLYANYGAEPLYWGFSQGTFTENRAWFNRFSYREEQLRGLDFQEDAYAVGYVEMTLKAGEECFLTFSTDEQPMTLNPVDLRDAETKRVEALRQTQTDPFLQDLVISANQFVVSRQSTNSETILAGYHWFTDWGRDTTAIPTLDN